MKKKLRKIKKYLAKPLVIAALCFVAGIAVTGAAFATVHFVQSNQKSQTTSTSEKDEPKAKKSPSPSPSPTQSASPTPTPAPSTPPTTATKPIAKAPSKSSPSYQSYHAACSKKNSDSYVKYNNAMAAENQYHQAILAELKQAYDNGEFADAGEDEYYAYQIAVEIENDRSSDVKKDIHIVHLSEMAANVCY